jgi:16S rRNA (guanine966-N2)-methyltransferase
MRITGGAQRSRALRAPKGDLTRPTADRVREAMFSILSSQRSIEGMNVLDLYAGTGALALEALSRGAGAATFVESSRAALAVLRANVAALGFEGRSRVVPTPVERSLSALVTSAPFDLGLADPPYAAVKSGAALEALGAVVDKGLFAPDAIVVLEHGKGDESPGIPGLTLSSSRRYGDTVLAFYELSHGGPVEG